MVPKCAHQNCSAEFRNLLEGRVFVAEARPAPDHPRATRYAWLCQKCENQMSLDFDENRGDFRVVPIRRTFAQAS